MYLRPSFRRRIQKAATPDHRAQASGCYSPPPMADRTTPSDGAGSAGDIPPGALGVLPTAEPSSNRSVLIVDDEPEVRELLTSFLENRGFTVYSVADGIAAKDALETHHVQIVLVDLRLAGSPGLELVKTIRGEFASLPIIIVTGYPSLQTAVEAMRAGASDFVAKPVDGPTLELRIEKALELESTRRLANTDGLTGLYNHRYFQQRLAEECERADRYGKSLSLALFDLDRFKAYNDRWGHPEGDRALIRVAEVLRSSSRSADVVSRYGGEEFAVILPESDVDAALILCERVRHAVEQLDLATSQDGDRRGLTISCGLGARASDEPAPGLLDRVDRALYRAKNEGRNRIVVCSETSDPGDRSGPA